MGSFSVFDGFSGDPVEGPLALVGDDSGVDFESVPLFVLLDVFLLFQLLEPPADDLGARVLVALGGALPPLESAVEVGEEADTSMGPEVDFASEGGDSVVEPVLIERGEFVS